MQPDGHFDIMPSEMVGIWGSIVYMTIYLLENKTSLFAFSALKLFGLYVFVFSLYSGSVGYIMI